MRLPTFFGSNFFKGLCFWRKEQKDVFESDLKESDLYIKKQLDAEEEKRKAEEEAEVSFDWNETKEAFRRFFARFRKKKSNTADAAKLQKPVSAGADGVALSNAAGQGQAEQSSESMRQDLLRKGPKKWTMTVGEKLDPTVKKEETGWRSWVPFALSLAMIVACFFGVRAYLTTHFGGVVVDGESMYDTLFNEEKLLMKYTSGGAKAKRGDIIVVDVRGYAEFKADGTQFLIKRLIATEGDKVKCVQGNLYVHYKGAEDYVLLEEDYARYEDKLKYSFDEYTVDEGEIFFLGDNRNKSLDSRYEQPNGSRLDDLYKETDIYGIVPEWAIQHRDIIEKIFFNG